MDYVIDPTELKESFQKHMFKIFTFTFLLILLWNTQNICGTEYHGIYVYGNCNELQDQKMNQAMLENLGHDPLARPDEMIEFIKPRPNPLNDIGATMQLDDDYILEITPTTTSTTTTTTTIPCPTCKECVCECPICTVTACPEIEYTELLAEVNTWRPDGAPAVQHGWFQMRSRLIEYLGGKPSKYREGPSISYKAVETKEETNVFQILKDKNECFTLSQYPDPNGRKRWNWNKEECLTSNITICHL